ncbi:DUF7149 domain-containing protein [Spirosoma sp.]|uniref:DUF7149 domain-containing protein n=1 Tax=Spirosoma sp. TaxID=1899569 RepID=UPI003B3B3041
MTRYPAEWGQRIFRVGQRAWLVNLLKILPAEVKRPSNKGEMSIRQNLNAKAFHELLLYYFQERERSRNSDIRHCVITNVYEWFIFDAALIDRLFYRNAHLTKEYKAWSSGQKVSKNNEVGERPGWV